MPRPRIGITSSYEVTRAGRERSYLNAAYSDAVYAAGGLPLPIALPPRPDGELLAELAALCDAVLLSGGADVDPRRFGEAPHPKTEVMHARRDAFEFGFFEAADAAAKPILAICLGCQVASVACGGKLIQHVDDVERPGAVVHYRPDHSPAYHRVRVDPSSRLASIVDATEFEVNSRHHQLVDAATLSSRFRPVAWAPDGVLEAAEDARGRFVIAVQWHPEDMIDRPEHLRLFAALVEEAGRARRGT